MRKNLYIFCIAVLSLFILTGCDSNENPSAPIPSEKLEISQDKLYQQFETVYDNCGSDGTQSEEHIAAEIAELEVIAADSDVIWPTNYEVLYKNYRIELISKRAESLQKDYEEIIAGRTLYQQGIDGLWETQQGLHYANIFDLNEDGKQELVLVSDLNTVEIFGDDKGHAVEFCKQSLDTFDSFDEYKDGWFNGVELEGISMGLKDDQPLIGVTASGIFGTSGHHPQVHIFYRLEGKNLSVAAVVQLTDAGYALTDEVSEYVEIDPARVFDIEIYQSSVDGNSMTAEQYQSLYGENFIASYKGIQDVGLLQKDEVVPIPQVEVNGELLELEIAPYAYNGEIMAPLRDVLEAMGVTVYVKIESTWTSIFASTKNDSLWIANYPPIYGWGVETDLGSLENPLNGEGWGELYSPLGNEYYYYFNGGEKIKTTVQGYEGKTFVPISIFSLFGTVKWNSESKILEVSSNIVPGNQLSQSDLEQIVNFSFDEANEMGFNNGYQVKPRGSSGSYWAQFQIAFGASSWRYNATYFHDTYGELIVHSDGTVEYIQLGELGPEDEWQ